MRDASQDVVLIGVDPADADGRFDVIRRLRAQRVQVVIFGAGWDRVALRVRSRALLAGAVCVLDSAAPEFDAEMRRRLRSIVALVSHLADEQRELRNVMAKVGIVGTTPVMLSLARWLVRVCTVSDLPVLISGETGTGKELIARAIHTLDEKRTGGPFVALNCAALTPSLAESELFGHRRGAFTGAAGDRLGLIRSAQGGVLFLDEIGDLDIALQGKLLRVLQENRVLAVGGDREEAISVRVIAATNRDLRPMVDDHRFRADLFYRLNVLSIRAPALSERRDDIPLLVAHFLDRCGRDRAAAGPTFLAALSAVDLSGNVRQLENLVRRAVAHASDEGPLCLEDLPAEVWEELSRGDRGADQERPSAAIDSSAALPAGTHADQWPALFEANGWNLSRSLRTCERLLLQAALTRVGGNQSKAARLLGVTPRSVYSKLRKHGLAGSELSFR
jgi:transcriptional regulator with GAF, ATPase, and Fis domain